MSEKKKILVVDDEAPIRQLGKIVLERCGYEVAEAANGTLALEMIGDLSVYMPDLIMTDLDYNTPGMNGVNFAREVKKRGYAGPITLGASGVQYVKQDYPDADSLFVDYLDKPFLPQRFVEVAKKHLPE